MDHNPFISRNNDLFIMLLAGSALVVINHYVFAMTVQQQFMVSLALGFLAGLFMSFLYQSLEWALVFTLGIQFVSLLPVVIKACSSHSLQLHVLARTVIQAGHYSLFLLSSWLIAIPTGFMLQRLIMSNYYRRNTL